MKTTQNFYELRQKCLVEQKLYEDPDFRPSKNLLLREKNQKVEWKRPGEICSAPGFVVNGFSRFDVQQGKLGNCWFLAALGTLTQSKAIFERVVLVDNSFEESYAGIFHFRFWKCRQWVEIVIDDRLPTVNGKLIYVNAPEGEFWVPLLEKAYAKLKGSYRAVHSGRPTTAMRNFTGGNASKFSTKRPPPILFKLLTSARNCGGALITASVNSKTSRDKETGIYGNHTYSLTDVASAMTKQGELIELVKVRNPWGNKQEWKGQMSDDSPLWETIVDDQRQALQMNKNPADGEFWMPFKSFLTFFDSVEICLIPPDSSDFVGDCFYGDECLDACKYCTTTDTFRYIATALPIVLASVIIILIVL